MRNMNILLCAVGLFSLILLSIPQILLGQSKIESEFQSYLKASVCTNRAQDIPVFYSSVKKLYQEAEKAKNYKDIGLCKLLYGILLYEAGQSSMAFPELKIADSLLIQHFGKNHTYERMARSYLSWTIGLSGDLDTELSMNIELLKFYKNKPSFYVLEQAEVLNTIGINYHYRLDLSTELFHLNEARFLLENYLPENDSLNILRLKCLANVYNSLAMSYLALGMSNEAYEYEKAALSLYTKICPQGLDEMNACQMVIGRTVYMKNKDAETATRILSQVYQAFSPGSAQRISYGSYLADIYSEENKPWLAIDLLRNVIEEVKGIEKLDNPTLETLVMARIKLSLAYISNAQMQDAIQIAQETKRIIEQSEGLRKILLSKCYHSFAFLYEQNKQYIQAENNYLTSLKIAGFEVGKDKRVLESEVPKNHELYTYLSDYGRFLSRIGKENQTKEIFLAGISVMETAVKELNKIILFNSEAGISEPVGYQKNLIYNNLLETVYENKTLIGEKQRLDIALQTIEYAKSTALAGKNVMENQLIKKVSERENSKRLKLKEATLKSMHLLSENHSRENQIQYVNTKYEYLKFLQEIKTKYHISDTRNQEIVHAHDPKLLTHSGTLINYFVGKDHLFIWAQANGKQQFIRKAIPAEFVNECFNMQKHLLNSKEFSKTGNIVAQHTISRKWFDYLLGNINLQGTVTIIPHNYLNQISFDMLELPNGNSGTAKYMLQEFPVQYETGISNVINSKHESPVSNCRLGGFAASDFSAIASVSLRREEDRGIIGNLVGTIKEVESILSIFNGKAFLHATPSTFLANASDFDILHIATHAFVFPSINQESEFLFEQEPSSGKAVVRDIEILTLPLKARLAVLSACNTGVGNVVDNEGIMSLGRSFMLAGCPAIVLSLWSVNDVSAEKIMTYFYTYLKKGYSKSKALQLAKVNYLKQESDPIKRHPYFWAGFIVLGDDSPVLPRIHSNQWLFVILIWSASSILIFAILWIPTILKKR